MTIKFCVTAIVEDGHSHLLLVPAEEPLTATERTLATLIRATAAWWAKHQTFIANAEDEQLDVDAIAVCADALASRGYLRRQEWAPTDKAEPLLRRVNRCDNLAESAGEAGTTPTSPLVDRHRACAVQDFGGIL